LTRIVLDASAALTWCFRDEETEYTRSLQLELVDPEIAVPSIWPYEIVNALVTAERRMRISRTDSKCFLDSLEGLKLIVDDVRLEYAFRIALHLSQHHEGVRLTA
jgi:predicted nucleic acid-binding protein